MDRVVSVLVYLCVYVWLQIFLFWTPEISSKPTTISLRAINRFIKLNCLFLDSKGLFLEFEEINEMQVSVVLWPSTQNQYGYGLWIFYIYTLKIYFFYYFIHKICNFLSFKFQCQLRALFSNYSTWSFVLFRKYFLFII